MWATSTISPLTSVIPYRVCAHMVVVAPDTPQPMNICSDNARFSVINCLIYCCRCTDLEDLATCGCRSRQTSMHLKIGSGRSRTHGYATCDFVKSRAMHTWGRHNTTSHNDCQSGHKKWSNVQSNTFLTNYFARSPTLPLHPFFSNFDPPSPMVPISFSPQLHRNCHPIRITSKLKVALTGGKGTSAQG